MFIEPDLKEFQITDWANYQQILQKGYDQTQQQLINTATDTQFWKLMNKLHAIKNGSKQ